MAHATPVGLTIRSHLLLLALGALIPVVLFTAAVTTVVTRQQRQLYEERYLERVKTITVALDEQYLSTVRALNALALAPALRDGRLADFYETAGRFKATQTTWASVNLARGDGEQVFNLNEPYGKALPRFRSNPELMRTATTGEALLTNIYRGRRSQRLLTSVQVPVHDSQGRITFVLSAVIEQPTWLEFLRKYPVVAGATMTLNDRDWGVVARSLNNERWAGRRSSDGFIATVAGRDEGYFRAVGLDGQPFYNAFSTSRLTGWRVSTGVPTELIDQELNRVTWIMAAGAGLAGIIAFALALALGLRITRSVHSLREPALKLSDGGTVPVPVPTPVAEVNELAGAFAEASHLLHQRERALEDALREVRQAHEESERANAAKDEFLAMLGHELRNPMAAIKNAVALLEHANAGPATHERARGILRRQVDHASGLINDLLDVARAMHGRISLVRAPLELGALVARVAETCRETTHARHRISIETAPALWISADEMRIEQIVANLVGNAIKFCPESGSIEVRAFAEREDIVLQIADDGPGIPDALKPRLFEPFTQGERTLDRAQGGLGLGLALVRRLVDLHGGRVELMDPGPRSGAAFQVRLPAIAHPERDLSPERAGAMRASRRILVVEDNEDSRASLVELLALRGHRVRQASDGASALEEVRRDRPEFALVDIGLPGMNGYEIASQLRGLEGLRLIALSGYGHESDRRRALTAGFEALIVKPADIEAIEQAMR